MDNSLTHSDMGTAGCSGEALEKYMAKCATSHSEADDDSTVYLRLAEWMGL